MGRTVTSSFHFIERPEKERRRLRSYGADSERKPRPPATHLNLSIFYHPGCLTLSKTDSPIRRGNIIWLKLTSYPILKEFVCVTIRVTFLPLYFRGCLLSNLHVGISPCMQSGGSYLEVAGSSPTLPLRPDQGKPPFYNSPAKWCSTLALNLP